MQNNEGYMPVEVDAAEGCSNPEAEGGDCSSSSQEPGIIGQSASKQKSWREATIQLLLRYDAIRENQIFQACICPSPTNSPAPPQLTSFAAATVSRAVALVWQLMMSSQISSPLLRSNDSHRQCNILISLRDYHRAPYRQKKCGNFF
jgi:hypothetical protein